MAPAAMMAMRLSADNNREWRIGDELRKVTNHGAPVRQRRLDADAEERQRRNGQEDKAEAQAKFRQKRCEGVWRDFLEDDR